MESNRSSKFVKSIKGRNIEVYERDYSPAELLVHFVSGNEKQYSKPITSRDVIVVNDLFCMKDDLSIYHLLVKELDSSNQDELQIWRPANKSEGKLYCSTPAS